MARFWERFTGGPSSSADRSPENRAENKNSSPEIDALRKAGFKTDHYHDETLRALKRGEFVVHGGWIFARPETTALELIVSRSVSGEDYGQAQMDTVRELGFEEREEGEFVWGREDEG